MGKSARKKTREAGDLDVLVIGAGAAGCTAAGLLARAGRSVAMIERAEAAGRPAAPRWISAGVDPLIRRLGISLKKTEGEPVRAVAFHTARFDKHQEVRLGGREAWFIDLADWNAMLAAAAVNAGAVMADRTTVLRLRMLEDRVSAECSDGDTRTARLLLIADGAESATARSIGMSLRPTNCRIAAQLAWPAAERSRLPAGTMHFVLGAESGGGLATFWSAAGREVAVAYGEEAAAARTALDRLLRGLVDHWGAVLPRKLGAESAGVQPVPAGHSLDIDSHVGKAAVAVGDAGGFVAAATCEGVYPAMWSAQIAAEVIDAALKDPHPQDQLREFDTRWRTVMADYLRPPNADLQFLLPLVFANRQMAERLAGAFLRGQNL